MTNIDVRISGHPANHAFRVVANSVHAALRAIADKQPELEAALWDNPSTVGYSVALWVNGTVVDPNAEAEKILNDGDIIDLKLPLETDKLTKNPDQNAIQSTLASAVQKLHRENVEQTTLLFKMEASIHTLLRQNEELRQSVGQSPKALRTKGSEGHPANFLDYAFHNDGDAIVAAMKKEFGQVTLVGPKEATGNLLSFSAHPRSVATLDWSPEHGDFPAFEGQGILCLIPESFPDWTAVAFYIEKMGGRLIPLWQVIMRYGLFKDLMRSFEYNVTEFDELLRLYTVTDLSGVATHQPADQGKHAEEGLSTDRNLGHRPMDDINALNEIIPLDGKSVIEFGPSDGNHTAAILSLGASPVTLVEGRGENVIKLLVAKWVMGWDRVEIHYDNFQLPGDWAKRRYDLVYAHGVYYHCQNPLIFLEMLANLGDSVFVGGWCATEAKPPTDWSSASFGGHDYRLKPYSESHHFLSGLAATSWMMDADEMIEFFKRRGFTVDVISRESVVEHPLGEVFLRLLARR